MSLEAPWLLAGLALLPLVYVFSRRQSPPLRRKVSSLLLWRVVASVVAAPPSDNTRQQAPTNLRTFLYLLAATALVFASTTPSVRSCGHAPRSLALILDETPSTQAQTPEGVTRRDVIADLATAALAHAHEDDQVNLLRITTGGDVALHDAVANALANHDRVLLLADHPLLDPGAIETNNPDHFVQAGPSGPAWNAGITSLGARRLGSGELGIACQLWLPTSADFTWRIDVNSPSGQLLDRVVVPDQRRDGAPVVAPLLVVPESAENRGPYQVSLRCTRAGVQISDGFPQDDVVKVYEEGSPIRVRVSPKLPEPVFRALRAANAEIVSLDAPADIACTIVDDNLEAGLPGFLVAAAPGSGPPARDLLAIATPGFSYMQPDDLAFPVAPTEPPVATRPIVLDSEGRTVIGIHDGTKPVLWVGVPLTNPSVIAAWAGKRSFPLLFAQGVDYLAPTGARLIGLLDLGETRQAQSEGPRPLPERPFGEARERGRLSLASPLLSLALFALVAALYCESRKPRSRP